MNAEYQSHKRVWEMLKPSVFDPLQLTEPPTGTLQTLHTQARFLEWDSIFIEPAMLAHGYGERSSPLSEW